MDEGKQLSLLHTGSKPNCRKKDTPNEIIRIPSLEGSSQWSSITKKTNDDLYDVKLGWDSANLKSGRNTIFMISFLDHKTNLEEKQIEYSFKVVDPTDNLTIKDVKHQKAPTGDRVEIVKLSMPGQLSISVNITFFQQQLYKIDTNNIDNIPANKLESVSFNITIPNKIPNTNSLNTRI
jgi:uncharacterized membrane protein YfhO